MKASVTNMTKTVFLILLLSQLAFRLLLHRLSAKQVDKPLPESVADIYDADEYARWRRYNAKTDMLSLISGGISLIVNIFLFCTNVLSWLYYALPGGEIAKAILIFLIMTGVDTLISLPIEYVFNFRIEAEFGFNRITPATFLADAVKNAVVGVILNFVIFLLVYGAYALFGAYFGIAAFLGICIFVFAMSAMSSVFMKLFNKFTPLEEGDLRTTLCTMFAEAGFRLKDIYVMDASKRTTKANAYCGGIGKFKQIVIFDNLLNHYSDAEITAVFAHELAHFKHRDTTKMTLFSLLNFLPIVAMMTVLMLVPEIAQSFGFAEPSILFAFYVAFGGVLDIVGRLISIPFNCISRAMERKADTFACQSGYADALVSALRKLHKDSLADMNPHPTVVALTANHPPLHERIALADKWCQKHK
ncbi:MAG: M48 family metallopeptidase [Clostridia bacterium]|nr:M48 family metallopeptidase [Clostridia bacterium]